MQSPSHQQPPPMAMARPAPWTPAPADAPPAAAAPLPDPTASPSSAARYHPYHPRPPPAAAHAARPAMPHTGPASSIPSPAAGRGVNHPHLSSSSSSSTATPHGAASSQHPLALAGVPPSAVFAATVENVRLLAPMLRAVHLRDWISLLLTPRGIRASVCDAAGSVQATAYIARQVFRTYHYAPPPLLPRPRPSVVLDRANDPDPASSRELLSPTASAVPTHTDDNDDDEPVRELQLTVDMPTLLDVLNVYNSAHLAAPSSASASLESHAAAVAAGIAGSSGSRGGGQPAHGSLGGVTALTLWCADPLTAPLQVHLDEVGVRTRAALHTFSDPDEAVGAGMALEAAWEAHGGPVYKLILGAGVLRDALAELGVRDAGTAGGKGPAAAAESSTALAASRVVSLTVLSPAAGGAAADPGPVPQLLLSTTGPAGSATVALAGSAMDVFQATVHEFTATYPAASLDAMMRALALARQVSVRANARGFLSVQCLVQVRVDVPSFIEFVVAPIEADEVEVEARPSEAGPE